METYVFGVHDISFLGKGPKRIISVFTFLFSLFGSGMAPHSLLPLPPLYFENKGRIKDCAYNEVKENQISPATLARLGLTEDDYITVAPLNPLSIVSPGSDIGMDYMSRMNRLSLGAKFLFRKCKPFY